MSPFKSTRIAWSVAVAALALWATSAPVSWGQAAADATHLFNQSMDDTQNSTTVINITQDSDINANTATDDSTAQAAPLRTRPPAVAESIPTITVPPVAVAPTSADSRTFHLCGADAQAEKDIAALIAGRSFNTTLSARGDGCADLLVKATSPATSGSSTSNLSVSLGSGRSLSIKITSQNGVTTVSIGQGQ